MIPIIREIYLNNKLEIIIVKFSNGRNIQLSWTDGFGYFIHTINFGVNMILLRPYYDYVLLKDGDTINEEAKKILNNIFTDEFIDKCILCKDKYFILKLNSDNIHIQHEVVLDEPSDSDKTNAEVLAFKYKKLCLLLKNLISCYE